MATMHKGTDLKIYIPNTLGGVTEQKKAELDALTILVLDAQQDVQRFQAIVDSLTEKSNTIQGFLAIDEGIRTQTYNNKVLMDQMAQSAKDLKNNSEIAIDEMAWATVKTKQLAPHIKILVDKLIYVAEVIDKLSNIIIRKKAINPLISDDLILMVNKAGKDANDAVALTLVALQSTFAVQASNLETEMAVGLEMEQADLFYEFLMKGKPSLETSDPNKSLYYYLNNAFTIAKAKYKTTEKAYKIVSKQLSDALTALNKAQVRLKSLQSGLAAANAVALL